MTADHDRLRAALAAAATAAPVPPAWDAIAERVTTGEVVLPPVRRRAPALAAAAAVVLLALAGVGLAVGRDDRGDVTAAGGSEAYCAVLARPVQPGGAVAVYLFLQPEPPAEGVDVVRRLIEETAGVTSWGYVASELAYEDARRLFEDEEALLELLRPEDVPPFYSVVVTDREAAEALVAAADATPEVTAAELGAEAAPDAPDVFTALADLARGRSETGFIPASTEVVDAFRATAPADLGRAVGPAAHLLGSPRGSSRLGREAVDTVVADAVERCGREVPSEPAGGAPDTTEAATTTTEPG